MHLRSYHDGACLEHCSGSHDYFSVLPHWNVMLQAKVVTYHIPFLSNIKVYTETGLGSLCAIHMEMEGHT